MAVPVFTRRSFALGRPSTWDSCLVPGLRVEGGRVRRYSWAILGLVLRCLLFPGVFVWWMGCDWGVLLVRMLVGMAVRVVRRMRKGRRVRIKELQGFRRSSGNINQARSGSFSSSMDVI